MKKILLQLLLLLVSFHFHIHAIIIESNTLEDIYKYADQNTIVVFDIDDTLIEIPLGLGRWPEYRSFELQKMGFSQKEAFEIVLPMFFTINQFVKLVPIGNSPRVIHHLQDKGIPVIGLTNRSIPIIERTIEQLEDIGIDFSLNSLFDRNTKLSITHMGAFCQGIIFTGLNNKGQMLFLLFEKTGYQPKKIIFIDDQLKHVKSVEKEAAKHNVDFVGIRFSLQDQKKASCNIGNLEKNFYNLKMILGMEPV